MISNKGSYPGPRLIGTIRRSLPRSKRAADSLDCRWIDAEPLGDLPHCASNANLEGRLTDVTITIN